jgi:hypothetical protein
MIEAPNGDHCPICRCSLFRPLFSVGLERALLNGLQRFALFLMFASQKVAAFWRQLPGWITFPLHLWWHLNNVYFYVGQFLHRFTKVRARNPGLHIDGAAAVYRVSFGFVSSSLMSWLFDWMNGLVPSHHGSRDFQRFRHIIAPVILVLAFSVLGAHGKFSNWRDRALFFFLMVTALSIQLLAATAMHPEIGRQTPGTSLGTTHTHMGDIAACRSSHRDA